MFVKGKCNVNGAVRLVDGASEREGRVEVCMEEYWGTVCSDGWSEEDALVVCRQAGFDTLSELHFSNTYPKCIMLYNLCILLGPVPLTNASFGRGLGPVHMTSVTCTGDEGMLSDCEHVTGLGAVNCHHARDAGVVCTSKD